MKQAKSVPIPAIAWPPPPGRPRHRALYQNLAEAILNGALAPGTQLPATRTWAQALRVSRGTVLAALEQLTAEGYVRALQGSGTFVADIPQDLGRSGTRAMPAGSAAPLSSRGRLLARTDLGEVEQPARPFEVGIPALDRFAATRLASLTTGAWSSMPASELQYPDPAGYPALRLELVRYLARARAVRADADQVIVVSGSQQALYLAAQLLLDPGDEAWMEDPGYVGALSALQAAGADIVNVPVDGEGLSVREGTALAPDARLVYVTPSHQYPTGATLSLARRLELLAWARQRNGWILEDDYDSEFRYIGAPLPALQGIDEAGTVLYVGTFSKILAPGLRLGYLVVPKALAPAFRAAKSLLDRGSAVPLQAGLARLLAGGGMERHLLRMRRLYQHRRDVLWSELREAFGDRVNLGPPSAGGMHLVVWLPPGMDDQAAVRRAYEHGVWVRAVSANARRPLPRGGLIVGYAGFSDAELREATAKLEEALRTLWP